MTMIVATATTLSMLLLLLSILSWPSSLLVMAAKHGGAVEGGRLDNNGDPFRLQPGFRKGMMIQSRALWAGSEIYFPEPLPVTRQENYCTQVMFWPEPYDYHTWQAVEAKCEDIGFDPLVGTIDGDWFGRFTDPGTVESTPQYKCLLGGNDNNNDDDSLLCSYDVTTVPEFSHCEVEAKACGAQLNQIYNYPDSNSCDVWQINLVRCPKMKNKNNNTTDVGAFVAVDDGDSDGGGGEIEMEMKLIQVVTYAEFEGPGFENYACPIRPTFNATEIVADPLVSGGATFVLQANFADVDLYDPCNWSCYFGEKKSLIDGISFNCSNSSAAPTQVPATEKPTRFKRKKSSKSMKSKRKEQRGTQ